LRIAIVVAIYVSACPQDWWAGAAFGPRRLSALTPLAAIGLAAVLTRMQRPVARVAFAAALSVWALFVTTAFLSNYDDLSVVFFSRVSQDNPHTLDTYGRARWLDAGPAWPRILRPGFTFSDRPRLADRMIGLLAAGWVVCGVTFVWSLIKRSQKMQRVALSAALLWVALALVWVAARPSNTPWDASWRRVVRDPDGCNVALPLPGGMSDARHVLCAARAERDGDHAQAMRHLSFMRSAAEYQVDDSSLSAAVQDAGSARIW
jgi:hypothetical protein